MVMLKFCKLCNIAKPWIKFVLLLSLQRTSVEVTDKLQYRVQGHPDSGGGVSSYHGRVTRAVPLKHRQKPAASDSALWW